MIAYMIPLAVFIFTALAAAAFLSYVVRLNERLRLIAKIKGAEAAVPAEKIPDELPLPDRIKRYFVNMLRRIGSYTRPKRGKDIDRLEKLFAGAGYRRRATVITYFGAKIFLAVLLGVSALFGGILFNFAVHPLPAALLVAVPAAAGFYLPDLWLRAALKKRREQILDGFPDALDLLVVCVEAGMSLDSAILRVSEEMKLSSRAISEELKLLILELKAGQSRRMALKNFGDRSGLEDVSSLATLLIQTDRFGTSISQALRVHADSMRVRRFQKAEEMAGKLPVKLIVPLVLCIFPSLFLVILGPAVIQVFRLLQS